MAAVDLGAAVTVSWPTVPAGAAAALAVTRPDGTTFTSPTVTQGPPATAAFTPDMAGRWLVRWTSTGSVAAYSDIVDVWPSDPRFIISLDDAKTAVGWAGGQQQAAVDDLRLYIAAATPVIEDIVGTVVVKTIVQVANGGTWGVALYETPLAITSITEGGGANTVTDYVVDPVGNVVYAGRVYAPRRFMPGPQSVTITYTAGYQVIPPNIRLATRELVRHWWQIGKQGLRSMNGTMPITADAWTPSGFAVPRRVMELCMANERFGGFA